MLKAVGITATLRSGQFVPAGEPFTILDSEEKSFQSSGFTIIRESAEKEVTEESPETDHEEVTEPDEKVTSKPAKTSKPKKAKTGSLDILGTPEAE